MYFLQHSPPSYGFWTAQLTYIHAYGYLEVIHLLRKAKFIVFEEKYKNDDCDQ